MGRIVSGLLLIVVFIAMLITVPPFAFEYNLVWGSLYFLLPGYLLIWWGWHGRRRRKAGHPRNGFRQSVQAFKEMMVRDSQQPTGLGLCLKCNKRPAVKELAFEHKREGASRFSFNAKVTEVYITKYTIPFCRVCSLKYSVLMGVLNITVLPLLGGTVLLFILRQNDAASLAVLALSTVLVLGWLVQLWAKSPNAREVLAMAKGPKLGEHRPQDWFNYNFNATGNDFGHDRVCKRCGFTIRVRSAIEGRKVPRECPDCGYGGEGPNASMEPGTG